MNYVKTLGFVAVVVAALMAFTAAASATIVTSNGASYTGTIKASSEGHVIVHGPLGIKAECSSSTEGTVTSHGAASTVTKVLSSVTFPGCTNGYTFHVKTFGHFAFHSIVPGFSGRYTSTSLHVELTTPLGFNCTYLTSETEMGVVTGSSGTGGKATMDASATLPRTGGSAFCGSSGNFTGSYVINTPSNLNID